MKVERSKPIATVTVNQNVSLVVRHVVITDGEGDNETVVRAVELREFLKNAEVSGHGIFVPEDAVLPLAQALGKAWNRQ